MLSLVRFVLVLSLILGATAGGAPSRQDPPPPAPARPAPAVPAPTAPAAVPPAAAPANTPAPAGQNPDSQSPGTQNPGNQNPGNPPADHQHPGAQDPADGDRTAESPKKPDRPGIPVEDLNVHTHCARCHAVDERQHMTRISYVRKSPEGWAETIKRMGRLHGMQLSPTDAKQLVRSLANSHGLTRSEAERGLYESERRVHWSEEHHDQDFKRACAQCHPLGRVLLQQRDAEEWQLLRATHVAMFPLSRGQMGGGPPEDERRPRGGSGGGPGSGGNAGSGSPAGGAANATGGNRGAAPSTGRGNTGGGPPGGGFDGGGSTQGVGDRVLQKLAADQPLFTPDWERWTQNRREVPLAGTWLVRGHEIGRGALLGTAAITRVDADEYDVTWTLQCSDGTTQRRTGKGLLYAGYSWRGRSQEATPGAPSWREVLLLDDAWQELRGRLFTGDHDELGADVTLRRARGRPTVVALGNAALEVPSTGHRLDVHGDAFPDVLVPADFFVGQGLTVTAVERRSAAHVVLTIDVAGGAELGPRTVALRDEPDGAAVVLYDTVDAVRIRPLQGLARIGGAKHPRQLERFEAWAVHRGKDGKPFTDDDVDLFQVRPRWALAEFKVRENDDDLKFVGSIDAATGVFTPNVDGPNPARKWQANNVGDVFVTAEIELDVPVRPAPKKPPAPPPPAAPARPGAPAEGTAAPLPDGTQPPPAATPDSPTPTRAPDAANAPSQPSPAPSTPPGAPGTAPVGSVSPGTVPPATAPSGTNPPAAAAPDAPAAEPANRGPLAPLPREKKLFFARSHLIVTVPIYVRWYALDWEDR